MFDDQPLKSPANMMYGKLAPHQSTKKLLIAALTSNYQPDMKSTCTGAGAPCGHWSEIDFFVL